jgi:hypothetical protein
VKDSGQVSDKDLSETERAELERLRKDNAVLRMERDFANYAEDRVMPMSA